jgi:hypothetical protein
MKNAIKIFVIALLFGACGSENEAPTITSFTLESSTITKQEGATLNFSYTFSDDQGLDKFRVSVIDDFEDARLSSAPWQIDNDYDLSGTSSSDSLSIALPFQDVEPGRYRLTLTVLDIDGAEVSESKTFFIVEPEVL